MAFLLAQSGVRATQRALRGPAAAAIQKRYLNVHEYQALEVFSKFGVEVPKNAVAKTADEAVKTAQQFGDEVVIKSQVLAGGRGLGYFKENNFKGGVHVIKTKDVEEYAKNMIGKTLITKQTGEQGKPNNMVLLCEKFSIKLEKYFAILMDRSFGGPVLVGSKVGGTSIEDIAAATPDAIIKMPIDIMDGIKESQANEMAKKMGFEGAQVGYAAKNIMNLYKTFIECDCTLLEINPFAELDDGRVIVCDAKVNFDDNAEFRQKPIHDMRDFSQEDAREVEAKKFDLNYIALDGSVACMVNGAGLAMSTMDLLSLEGGSPANFLDVGGGATKDAVKAAFTIIQEDPKVKAIFVNIFGGIMRCDVIAEGIVGAVKELGLKKPLVVRLVGTNVEMGKKILEESKLPLEFEADFAAAAKRAVAVAV